MALSIKHAGIWKTPEVHVKHSGAWKRAEVFVKKSGVWEKVAYIVTHALSPTSKTDSSTSATKTLTGSISNPVTGGTVTSRTWGFTGQSGGTWSVVSGQGTASVTIRCTANAQEVTSTATLYCDAVVGGETYRSLCSCSYTWIDIS